SAAGKKMRCPGCDTIIKIPRPRRKLENDDFGGDLDSFEDLDLQSFPDEALPARQSSKKSSSRKKKKSSSAQDANPVAPQLAWQIIGGIMLCEFLVVILRSVT
ncbi:MAG: hypothetical protein KDA78_21360, partial [Planctomycetaceae bacterium]|nr:hypothetical protein [Planctomycetaceae bacterium]